MNTLSMTMFHALALLVILTTTACKPEIVADTYSCGPERFCPENLACNDETANCSSTINAGGFACPLEQADQEPDETPAQGRVLGELTCGSQIIFEEEWACLDRGDDVDHFRFAIPTTCVGSSPHVQVRVRYRVAHAPVYAELLDGDGQVLASAALCTPESDDSGIEMLCLVESELPPGTYDLRIGVRNEANCDGDCAFNHYLMTISYPLS